jgi:tRNA-dihydrouridine synthase A
MTRLMLGLFHGQPGGRLWRRILSEEGARRGAGLDVVRRALDVVRREAQSRERAGETLTG